MEKVASYNSNNSTGGILADKNCGGLHCLIADWTAVERTHAGELVAERAEEAMLVRMTGSSAGERKPVLFAKFGQDAHAAEGVLTGGHVERVDERLSAEWAGKIRVGRGAIVVQVRPGVGVVRLTAHVAEQPRELLGRHHSFACSNITCVPTRRRSR